MREIIDSHAHIFPEKIAEKASNSIGEFYDIAIKFDGRVDTLLDVGKRAGVSRFLVHSVATVPRQVQSINNFIAEQVANHPDKFIGFCSLHPDLTQDEIDREIKRVQELGLKGIKLHPDFQKFKLDHKKSLEMFEVIGDRLPVLMHIGDIRYGYSSPKRLVNIMRQFPKITCIAAHFGGWSEWQDGAKLLCDSDCYVDTCSSFYTMTKETARDIISMYNPDKILFGSDFPMWDSADEIKFLNSLGIDEELLDKIYSKNLLRLLDIK